MNAWKKIWPAVGFVCGLLSACGGGDSSTSTTTQTQGVSTSDTSSTTVASTLDFNVSQVFANYHGLPASYTLSETRNGVTWKAVQTVTPIEDALFNGQQAKRTKFSTQWWKNGVRETGEDSTAIVLFALDFFRLLGQDWSADGVVEEQFTERVHAPVGVKVGSTGPLGHSEFHFGGLNGSLLWTTDYTYSVEAASSSDTAWVCENSVDLTAKTRVIEDKQQFCILTNANSDILGLRLDAQALDANGKVTDSISLR